jgi:hypothetical protein
LAFAVSFSRLKSIDGHLSWFYCFEAFKKIRFGGGHSSNIFHSEDAYFAVTCWKNGHFGHVVFSGESSPCAQQVRIVPELLQLMANPPPLIGFLPKASSQEDLF